MKKRVIFFAITVLILLTQFLYLKGLIKNMSDDVATLRNDIFILKSKIVELDNDKVFSNNSDNGSIGNIDQKITYTIFSSPKTDFTFEYPNTWTYKEIDSQNPDSIGWNFYVNAEDKSVPPIVSVAFPLTDWVGFCSKEINPPDTLAEVNTYKTNDSTTDVVYEKCGDTKNGFAGGYIYWQKGKHLSNANDIKDINKVNLINISYSGTENKTDVEIMKHIAQSIRIK